MNNFEKTLYLLSEEMSIVCRYNNYFIYIYNEPQQNPSFHVRYKDEWEVVLKIIDFSILENKFGVYKKGNRLPRWIEKDIKESLDRKIGETTYWQHLIITWNETNPDKTIDVNMIIPI